MYTLNQNYFKWIGFLASMSRISSSLSQNWSRLKKLLRTNTLHAASILSDTASSLRTSKRQKYLKLRLRISSSVIRALASQLRYSRVISLPCQSRDGRLQKFICQEKPCKDCCVGTQESLENSTSDMQFRFTVC
uniref:Uncharacterized protein n=1 Tax=Spironucleus salmonicida TaxID=348837 RepID=V6LN09_9EUKA|eukprot:EST45608.1 Hypothetical protein SS50377_jh057 [Spironucleus salmonicida]